MAHPVAFTTSSRIHSHTHTHTRYTQVSSHVSKRNTIRISFYASERVMFRAERAKRASFSRMRIGVQTMKTEPGAHVTREKVHETITNQDIIEASICKVLPTAETHATLSQAPATHAYNIIIIHRTGIGPALPRRPLRSENSQTHKHV